MKIKIVDANFSLYHETGNRGPLPFPLRILLDNEKPSLPEECVSVREAETPDQVAMYMTKTGVWNAIQNEPELLENRLLSSAHLIQNPSQFFKDPTKAILAPQNEPGSQKKSISERRWRFRSLGEKGNIINEMQSYIESIPGAKGLAKTVICIADELFTNALFNAPFGDLNSTLDRSTLVVLDPDMSGEMIIGNTEDRLFLGCLDVFGTLSCDDLLERIYNGFTAGIGQSVNMEKGGAGIGILRLVDLASDIYAVVEKDKKTLVGCSFVLNRGAKKILRMAKSFHFQSFQTIESPSGAIRIERRGRRALLRISGNIKDDFRFNEFDLEGVEEANLDLSLLKQTDSQILRIPLEVIKNTASIKKLSFEYVPYQFLLDIQEMIKQSEAPGEIRSVWLPFHCSSCNASENVFFIRSEGGEANSNAPHCTSCGTKLEPNSEIRNYIQI